MIGNLPNLLTLTRILLMPFFAAAVVYGQYRIALIIFITAAVTDLLDGFTARITNQITYFGRILDPVADKFLLLTSYILMSIYGMLPKWLAIIVISKDVIVVTGCVIIYLVTHNLKIEPTFVGKIASASQFFLIGLILFLLNIDDTRQVHWSLFVFVALLTGASGLHYVYRGFKTAHIHQN